MNPTGKASMSIFFQKGDSTTDPKIAPFSVGFVDGQNKCLIIQTIMALTLEFVISLVDGNNGGNNDRNKAIDR